MANCFQKPCEENYRDLSRESLGVKNTEKTPSLYVLTWATAEYDLDLISANVLALPDTWKEKIANTVSTTFFYFLTSDVLTIIYAQNHAQKNFNAKNVSFFFVNKLLFQIPTQLWGQ